MSSTIFTARPYDPRKARRRWIAVLTGLGIILVFAVLFWIFRFWPEQRVVAGFFDALQQQNYEEAYGIWMADPDWKEHPEKHARYPFSEFHVDWGPGGEYGVIRSYRIEEARRPPGGGSGVIVIVTVNERADPEARARLWVEDHDRSLTYSPF
jgi:hypothetical protein